MSNINSDLLQKVMNFYKCNKKIAETLINNARRDGEEHELEEMINECMAVKN